MLNPIDWLTWAYEKWFIGHALRGYFVISVICCFVLCVLLIPFWTRAVDNYEKSHPKVDAVVAAHSNPPNATAQNTGESKPPNAPKKKAQAKTNLPIQTPPTQNALGGINIGRDNNGIAMVNNFAPPSRRIAAEYRQTVIDALKPNPGKIDIHYAMGDEPNRYAQDLYGVLKSAGWDCSPPWPVMIPGEQWKGMVVRYHAEKAANPGESVSPPTNTPVAALLQAIVAAHLRKGVMLNPDPTQPEGSIELVISTYPD